ncbi:Tn3 family transposase [Streptomyces arenae]|nr:Tn3 family transposase [Streptomyces arenae]
MESCNSAHRELFHGKDGALTGSGKEFQEMSMPALHLFQSALVRTSTPCFSRAS